MNDEEFRQRVDDLRAWGAVWFNNVQLTALEAFIAEAERLRALVRQLD